MTSFSLPTASTVTHPEAWGYGASLDELLVRLAVGPQREVTIESAANQAQRINTEVNPEDFVPEYGQVFSRSGFTGGEGLDFAHRSNPSPTDASRFWDSKGVSVFQEVPGQLRTVQLLEEFEAIAATGTDTEPWLVVVPSLSVAVVVNGLVVEEITDLDTTPSVATVDPFTGAANALGRPAVLGHEVYIPDPTLATSAISVRAAAGTWAVAATIAGCDALWSAKDRLIGADGVTLQEWDQTSLTSAPTTLYTLATGETWTDVIDAGAVILAASDNGFIYVFRDVSGTLTLMGQHKLSDFDMPQAMASAGGFLFISTKEPNISGGHYGRIWRAVVTDEANDFALANVQLLREYGTADSTLDHSARAFTVRKDSVYWGVQESALEASLWCYYLPTGGLARDRVATVGTGTIGAAFGIGVVDGIFVASFAGQGMWRDNGNLVSGGYLITPAADHFTSAVKSWLGVTTFADALDDGGELEILYSTDPADLLDPASTGWKRIQLLTGSGGEGLEIALFSVQSRWLALQARITSDSVQEHAPRLHSMAARSYTDSKDLVITIPVNISDRIERPGKRPLTVPGWGNRMYEELVSREGKPVLLEVYNPPTLVRGSVEAVGIPINHMPRRGSAGNYCFVRVRGGVVEIGTSVTGQGALGIGGLGISTLGV